jgi:hypothetical protein
MELYTILCYIICVETSNSVIAKMNEWTKMNATTEGGVLVILQKQK